MARGRLLSAYLRFRTNGGYVKLLTAFWPTWMLWNLFAPQPWHFDVYPFIVLNLVLSIEAAYAMPVFLREQYKTEEEFRQLLKRVLRGIDEVMEEVEDEDG